MKKLTALILLLLLPFALIISACGENVLDEPVNVELETGEGYAILTWEAPESAEEGFLTGYAVKYEGINWIMLSKNTFEYNFENLTKDEYVFMVVAVYSGRHSNPVEKTLESSKEESGDTVSSEN